LFFYVFVNWNGKGFQILKSKYGFEKAVISFLMISLSGLLLFSCSGKPQNAEKLVKKVTGAYGGAEETGKLGKYTGSGFLKKLPVGNMVKNYPLTVFQDKHRYKEFIAHVKRGDPIDKWVWINDGDRTFGWSSSDKLINKPMLEISLIKYRFPLILSWIQSHSEEGSLVGEPKEGSYKMRFEDGERIITVTVEDKSWLINRVEINSPADSLIYSEEYSTYNKAKGIPLPSRARRSVNGKSYCEAFIPAVRYGINLPDSVFTITGEDTLITEEAE